MIQIDMKKLEDKENWSCDVVLSDKAGSPV